MKMNQTFAPGQNPLAGYTRKPEIHVKLPSGGNWWPAGSIEIPPNGELPVMAMTGHDDVIMRNADGLMNGASSVEVIQSCVPAIKNAWQGPNLDIEYLFIAIRIASYGAEMNLEGTCSKCKEVTEFGINLQSVLAQLTYPDYSVPISVNGLSIFLKPATYQITNTISQEIFEQQRAILASESRELLLEQKQKIIKESIQKLSVLSISKMSEYIDHIRTPEGVTVTEQNYIQEFIDGADRKTFDAIKKGIDNVRNNYGIPMLPFVCSNNDCQHHDEIRFEFNPGNFFAADS